MADYWLAITFADGREVHVDLSDVIRRGGAFEPLRDRRLFALARASAGGKAIEWPEPRDANGVPLLHIEAKSLYVASEPLMSQGAYSHPSQT